MKFMFLSQYYRVSDTQFSTITLWLNLLFIAGCTFEGSIVKVEDSSLIENSANTNTDVRRIPDSATTMNSPDSTDDGQEDTWNISQTGSNSATDTVGNGTPSTDTTHHTSGDSVTGIQDTLNKVETDSDTRDVDNPIFIDTAVGADTSSIDPVTDATFSFFSLADMQDRPYVGENHIRSMAVMDPDAIALIEVGDFSHYGSESEWESHMEALKNGAVAAGYPEDYFRTTAVDWGDYIRLVGAVGNHEHWSSDWYTYWNRYLPGQQNLGVNSESRGVYFTMEYANMLFIILDSNFSNPEQTEWLKNVLEGPQAQFARWKVAFFHESVYPCNSKAPLSSGLPWVALFEKYKVDLVVHGHAHTFERTCPMNSGKCVTGNQHGVIYLTASGGGTSYLRTVQNTASGSVTYEGRTDKYECEKILADYDSGWQHFCHYTVGDCELNVRCYDYDYWDTGELQHEFAINRCK
jgi:hypothetical protein